MQKNTQKYTHTHTHTHTQNTQKYTKYNNDNYNTNQQQIKETSSFVLQKGLKQIYLKIQGEIPRNKKRHNGPLFTSGALDLGGVLGGGSWVWGAGGGGDAALFL